MKTKEKKAVTTGRQEKSVLQQLRDIRDNVSTEIQNLTYVQLMDYLDKQKTLHPTKAWRKAVRH